MKIRQARNSRSRPSSKYEPMLERWNARSAIIHERLEISLKQVLTPLAQEAECRPPACAKRLSRRRYTLFGCTKRCPRCKWRRRNELGRHYTRFGKNRIHMAEVGLTAPTFKPDYAKYTFVVSALIIWKSRSRCGASMGSENPISGRRRQSLRCLEQIACVCEGGRQLGVHS